MSWRLLLSISLLALVLAGCGGDRNKGLYRGKDRPVSTTVKRDTTHKGL
jgi:hypothetical protein